MGRWRGLGEAIKWFGLVSFVEDVEEL